MKRTFITPLLAWCLAAAWTGTAAAASPEPAAATASVIRISDRLGFDVATAKSGPDCAGGIRYDDGGFEDAQSVPRTNGLQVMSFDLPANASGVQQVCVALTRLAGTASPDLSFDVVFYAADGPAGSPGTLLGSVPGHAPAVPVTSGSTVNTQFYAVAIGSALTLPSSRRVYVGLKFDGSQGFFIGIDGSPTTAYRDAFVSTDGGLSWQTEASADPGYRAYGIRVDPQLAQTNCVASTTAMCLQADRFEVQATFQPPNGAGGTAETVRLTPDSGYLWFFGPSNIEAIVKVLDACGLNQRFWVFAGGLTNVHAVITVTDTRTGASRRYPNPQNTPFQPLQDTGAFPCP